MEKLLTKEEGLELYLMSVEKSLLEARKEILESRLNELALSLQVTRTSIKSLDNPINISVASISVKASQMRLKGLKEIAKQSDGSFKVFFDEEIPDDNKSESLDGSDSKEA